MSLVIGKASKLAEGFKVWPLGGAERGWAPATIAASTRLVSQLRKTAKVWVQRCTAFETELDLGSANRRGSSWTEKSPRRRLPAWMAAKAKPPGMAGWAGLL